MREAVIIGGGISGLSAAYYLAKSGVPSTILESRPRLGGVIRTGHMDGCTVETGPDSFLSTKPAALELIRDLGMASQVIGSNDHLRITYVWKRGRLLPLPDGLMMMVPTKILPLLTTNLLSWGTKLRMGLELFHAPAPLKQDKPVSEFIEEHYGSEAVDYLAEPLLSGIYGGNPAQLSVMSVLPRFAELAGRYGSLTRGVLASRPKTRHRAETGPLFRTLKGGLGTLVDALQREIQGHTEILQGRAEAVERTGAGFRVRIGGDWMETKHVVAACEAHSAARLLAPLDPRLHELLSAIPYSSSITVAMGFRAGDLKKRPSGFGFLVPRKERRRLVACTWVGTKFPYRAPEDVILARCFLGGMEDPGILAESDAAIAGIVSEELRDIAGITARPIFTSISRLPLSMAQYTIGHGARVTEIQARVSDFPGLHLAGNAYEGIGIPDCIRMGKRAAEAIRGS